MLKIGKRNITSNSNAYVIAEIGHNHQGSIKTALKMVEKAAECGVDAVKFQKRNNKQLFTKNYYNRLYDNENSYGSTYGEHREFLEFGHEEYTQLKKRSEELNVDFFSTAFDIDSVDFLENLGVQSYKIASADVTNLPLIKKIAETGKPVFLSTGACTLEEIHTAYNEVLKHHDQLCLLHCTAGYPTEYKDLNLKFIEKMKKEFPKAVPGYSGHDNGILAAVVAYMLGAVVIEKHFTLNHAWKGTDHKYSLEPQGMMKQVRDLKRISESLGDGEKVLRDFEKAAREKMGKSIYAVKDLPAGTVLQETDFAYKTPAGGLPPYRYMELVGKKLKSDVAEEDYLTMDIVE